MQENKVFKVYLGFRKDTNSRFDHAMNYVKADIAESAKKMAKKLTISRNPGIKEIVVNNCFEQTGDEIKKVPANRILTKENFSQWIKVEETITSTPGKEFFKKLTNPEWLKKKPTEKSSTIAPAKVASKPVTQIPWLKKKTVVKPTSVVPAKPVVKVATQIEKPAGETDWNKINALAHNRDFDENN